MSSHPAGLQNNSRRVTSSHGQRLALISERLRPDTETYTYYDLETARVLNLSGRLDLTTFFSLHSLEIGVALAIIRIFSFVIQTEWHVLDGYLVRCYGL